MVCGYSPRGDCCCLEHDHCCCVVAGKGFLSIRSQIINYYIVYAPLATASCLCFLYAQPHFVPRISNIVRFLQFKSPAEYSFLVLSARRYSVFFFLTVSRHLLFAKGGIQLQSFMRSSFREIALVISLNSHDGTIFNIFSCLIFASAPEL
jgi:hypothetical protein